MIIYIVDGLTIVFLNHHLVYKTSENSKKKCPSQSSQSKVAMVSLVLSAKKPDFHGTT